MGKEEGLVEAAVGSSEELKKADLTSKDDWMVQQRVAQNELAHLVAQWRVVWNELVKEMVLCCQLMGVVILLAAHLEQQSLRAHEMA